VTEAENGKIAVELAARHQFDLILMDISMPVMDGRTATRAIRASGLPSANTPIVALTANAMAEERKAFLSDGMNAILTKPMSREGLFEVLGLVLDAARAPSPASDAQTVIDPRNMEDLLELLGKPALHALLARFRAELDDVIGMLTLDQPLEQLAEHAHRIAGSAATVGAVRLRQTLIRIENAAKQGDVSALSDGITRLPEVWQATRPLLVVA
jgi:CheY-like chemotaxis protein